MSGGRPSSWSRRRAATSRSIARRSASASPACRGVVEPALDAGPLLGDDLVELAPDVAEDVVEPVALEHLLASPLEPLHQVAQAGHVAAGRVARAPATLHQPSEGLGRGRPRPSRRRRARRGSRRRRGRRRAGCRPRPSSGPPGRARRPRSPPRRGRWPGTRCDPAPDRADPGSTRSPVVDRPAGHAVLVEPPREVEALEQELDGRCDDRGLLGAVGHVERAEPRGPSPPARAPRASSATYSRDGVRSPVSTVKPSSNASTTPSRSSSETCRLNVVWSALVMSRSTIRSSGASSPTDLELDLADRRGDDRAEVGDARRRDRLAEPDRPLERGRLEHLGVGDRDPDADARALADLRASGGRGGSARRRAPP